MAIQISVGYSDPPTVTIAGATPADSDKLPALVGEVVGRQGIRLGIMEWDAADPNGTYPAAWAGERSLDVRAKL